MPEPSVLLRRPYQVAGVPIWVEAVGDRSSISGISIDTAGGKLARRGAQAATTPLGRRADRQFRAYCADPRRAIKLPLAQHEQIPSQRAAMAFLARIPLGETRSYQEQARAVKRQCRNGFNARNAGNANRGNHYPLAIPCHRVIRSDGDVGGFMGSTGAAARELKQALLRHEGALT